MSGVTPGAAYTSMSLFSCDRRLCLLYSRVLVNTSGDSELLLLPLATASIGIAKIMSNLDTSSSSQR
jgi:hypothetical protein